MAWTTPITTAVGDPMTAALWNTYIRDNENFLYAPPSARIYNSAAISIPNNTISAVTFDSERYDNSGLHSTSSNTSRLTAPVAGKYLITGHVEWAANATGQRKLLLKISNTLYIAIQSGVSVGAGDTTAQSVSTVYSFGVGDYVELYAFQTSGGALNLTVTGGYAEPELTMQFVGN